MSEYTATGVTFVICALVLWRTTRKSTSRYIRFQWKRPSWILARLLVLVLVFHGAFVLLRVHPAVGFPTVAFSALILAGMDISGVIAMAVGAVGWTFHEWIFWLPSRRQLVLRTPIPVGKPQVSELIGVEAIAVSDLKPAGEITLHGVKRSARSEGGFIAKGEKVVLKAVGDFELTVRKISPTPTSNFFRDEPIA